MRSTSVPKVRSMLQLLDDSNHQISLAMWGEDFCDQYAHLKVGQCLAVKGAKVSDFGGHSLNAAKDHAQLFIDLEDNAISTRL